ncbi:hypothetical protein HWV62_30487 [Athelia sp. TMB]|nr:hypothetical protein HWV62_30487 [Athelia sp. TMB]
MVSKTNYLSYPALSDLKSTVIALDPSSSYADMLTQFQLVEVALARAKLERAAAENRSIPIASLPHELISRIFEVHRNLHFDSNPWADCIAPTIRVSHVSAKWRDIALFTASLWTTVAAFPHYTNEFYHTVIHRSRESLLDLTIRVNGPGDTQSASLLAEFIPSQTHRLYALRIRAPMDFIDDHMPALRELSAPRMTWLSLDSTTPGIGSGSLSPPQRIFTGGVQRLSRYEALGFDPRIWPPLFSIAVLRIQFCNAAAHSAHLVLREASLTVSRLFLSVTPRALSMFQAIQMPSLEYMEIVALPFDTAMLLEMIEAQSLKRLCLFTLLPGRFPPPLHVHDAAVGKYPKLHTLELRGVLGSGILPNFPTIRVLVIVDVFHCLAQLGDIFDCNQEAFSTLTPRLTCITAPERFKETVEAFGAARRSLGLSVPRFIAGSDT